MRPAVVLCVLMPLSAAVLAVAQTGPQQATIEDTGSTNRPGVKMIVNASGLAEVQTRDAESRKTSVDAHMSERLFQDLKSAGPLGSLPRAHCIKSVSFGSSLYIEFHGERSPDLNCPAPPDSKVARLQKDVRDLMDAAHATSRMNSRVHVFTVPRD